MHVFKARVVGGRLTLDEPTDLPDGMVLELVPAQPEDEMSPEERAELHAAIRRGIADAEAGRVTNMDDFLAELEAAESQP
jgi:hypothetical protein